MYKGQLERAVGYKMTTEVVAVKTLKGEWEKVNDHSLFWTSHGLILFLCSGFYDSAAVKEMLRECSKMYIFDHPNVLSLTGVCLDGGTAPYIIMPFMANGSLLAHLKKNRASLVLSSMDSDEEEV